MSSENPTRLKILTATLSLLQEGGGSKVRMSDIAKAAGVSRQAVYLHFDNRAELLIAATQHLDELEDTETRLLPSRTATSGPERLHEWVKVWGGHIPLVYGVAKALLAMKDDDAEAAAAWDNRMQGVRHGCAAAVRAIAEDGLLPPDLTQAQATDLLWSLQSIRVWEQLRFECGWSQETYITHIQTTAARMLIANPDR